MTDEIIKRKLGRPSKRQNAVKYTVTVPAEVAPLAERAKTDYGLGKLLADCLQERYASKEDVK